jgi:serine/threonine protein kinase
LKKLSHPNIVGLMEYSVEGDNHILAMEYCSGATLDQYIAKRKMGEDTVRGLFKQLAAGMKYMWSKNIIHRDLKPQNILFSSKGPDAQLKIIDFGFSRIRTTNLMTSIVGTPIYMAPELLRCQPYTAKIDLWSLGCILYEMLTGVPPFVCNTHYELMQLQAAWTGPTLPQAVRVSPECMDLLSKLLCADPVRRMEWNEFFSHPFIASSNLLAEATIDVHIEPLSRHITLNTQDLDAASLVSAFKAQMLVDGTDDQEKYEGVAALLECKDGSVVELLDDAPISYYAEQFSTAANIYLVLPLNKVSIKRNAKVSTTN